MELSQHPISRIEWLPVEKLEANDYNPNHVYGQELKLLEHSLLSTGWIQPVLVAKVGERYEIIDGFHRTHLTRTSSKVFEMTGGRVPCAVLELSEAERIMLTIRINRAKGAHIALRMSKCIHELVNDHGCTMEQICTGIGATRDEVELLMMDDVFKKLDIENYQFSKAWVPKK